MTIVVGVDPAATNNDVVTLAARLHRLMRDEVLLVSVRPPTVEIPSRGNVDAEWTAFLHAQAQAALDAASQFMAHECGVQPAKSQVVAHASISRALRTLAAELNASAIVIGPGASGTGGHVMLGSVAQSLLHSGETAVALAPGGYAATSGDFTRLVVGFEATSKSESIVGFTVELARPANAHVGLLTIVSRVTRIIAPRLGDDPEGAVLQALTEQAEQAQAFVRDAYPTITSAAVEQGDTVQEAMTQFDWNAGDLFILGSSADGVLRRVFLGDTSHQLLRASTVPVMVLPRD